MKTKMFGIGVSFLGLALGIFHPLTISAQDKPQKEDPTALSAVATNLVQVDAIVLDKQGKPVPGLTQDDFHLSVDGNPQPITYFSYVSLVEPKSTSQPVSQPGTASKLMAPPVTLSAQQHHRTVALVIDDLGLSFSSLHFLRESLKRFALEQLQPTDEVAIMRTGGGIGALQRFTTDRQQLLAAIENLRFNQNSRSRDNEAIRAVNYAPGNLTGPPQPPATPGSQGRNPIAEIISQVTDPTRVSNDVGTLREELLTVGTLGALNLVVRGMKDVPGRKEVVLISDGIRVLFTNRDNGRVRNALYRLTEAAHGASVVIHTMDARGLSTLDRAAGSSPVQDYIDGQEGLHFLASETGGSLYKNTNDLNRGLQQVLDQTNGYYVLGYELDTAHNNPPAAQPAERKIKLTVNQPGLTVRSRNGFLGTVPGKPELGKQNPVATSLTAAILSPFTASDIRLRLSSTFTNEPQYGSCLQSLLHIDARDLTFTRSDDGWNTANVNVVAVTFKDDDLIVDQSERNLVIRLKDEPLKVALENGLLQTITLPVKKTGAYQLRVAFKDQASARIGSAHQFVQIPNVEKGQFALASLVVAGLQANAASSGSQSDSSTDFDPLANPAVRQFKPGMDVVYGLVIHNARLSSSAKIPDVDMQIRLFCNGKLILEGTPHQVETRNQPDLKRLQTGGQFKLGPSLKPGQYVLQVIVQDKTVSGKEGTVSQWVDFEVKN
ncbi:MAG: VWA domain-containing protein [Blastocatellia bacterium]|nr:VWA domain-containing protein [Blastocatellia bacterium]